MMQTAKGAIDREVVARTLQEVFSRSELRPPGESWLDRQLQRLLELFPGGELPEAAAWGLLWLIAVVLGLMLGWVLVQLRRNIAWRRAPEVAAAAVATGSVAEGVRDRLAELRRRAFQAREQGDLVLALRLHFFALLVGLGRRGGLEYRDSWTARELLSRGRPSTEVAQTLAPLVHHIDERTFGRRPVVGADVDAIEALGARWLDAAEGPR